MAAAVVMPPTLLLETRLASESIPRVSPAKTQGRWAKMKGWLRGQATAKQI